MADYFNSKEKQNSDLISAIQSKIIFGKHKNLKKSEILLNDIFESIFIAVSLQ